MDSRLHRWVLAVFALHLTFCTARLFYASYGHRATEIMEWHEKGELGYQFRYSDDASVKIATWLCEKVPLDQVVLYTGEARDRIQILAPLLSPRLLVRAKDVPPDATMAAGKTIFRGQPPWPIDGNGDTPVVEGQVRSLGLRLR